VSERPSLSIAGLEPARITTIGAPANGVVLGMLQLRAVAPIGREMRRLMPTAPEPERHTSLWFVKVSVMHRGRANLRTMAGHDKILQQVLDGRSDANIRFEDLRSLLLAFGFVERTRGSHHVFRKLGIEEQINLQRDGSKAKPYQVKQVRGVILRYNLQES